MLIPRVVAGRYLALKGTRTALSAGAVSAWACWGLVPLENWSLWLSSCLCSCYLLCGFELLQDFAWVVCSAWHCLLWKNSILLYEHKQNNKEKEQCSASESCFLSKLRFSTEACACLLLIDASGLPLAEILFFSKVYVSFLNVKPFLC